MWDIHYLALTNLPGDPLLRLALRFTAQTEDGTFISQWLATNGDDGAKRINTVVDWIEGRNEFDTNVPRRYFVPKGTQGGGAFHSLLPATRENNNPDHRKIWIQASLQTVILNGLKVLSRSNPVFLARSW